MRIVDRLAKWKLHQFYLKDKYISSFLPPTAVLTKKSLQTFMERYSTIYIKANTIHTGKAIIKAWKKTDGSLGYVKVRGRVHTAHTYEQLLRQVKSLSPNELFLVQKGIQLASIKGRPYDIRVMMMRDGQRVWKYAGMVAKVHGESSIVSNVARGGGYVISVHQALAQSNFPPATVKRIEQQLIRLSRRIVIYSEKYPFYSFQSGIDLAVDTQGRVWIIEVNLHNPSHGLFRQLNDKTSFRRIRALYNDYLKHNTRII